MRLSDASSRFRFSRTIALVVLAASLPGVRAAGSSAKLRGREDSSSAHLVCSPAGSLNFGAVRVGTRVVRAVTLTATNSAVTILSAASSRPEFVVQGLLFPVRIARGETRSFIVIFEPQESGAVSATVSFRRDDGNAPTIQSLMGAGIAVRRNDDSPSVDLSWDLSSALDVVGYNVYRGTTSVGPYTKINSVLDPTNVFTDDAVVNGATYFYVTTAVDEFGQESVYSNEVAALIP